MKLVIQIPAFNEADSLGETLGDLPRSVPGFDVVEIMVVDDGSTDGTAEVARALGAHHVERLPRNMGLATAFMTGIDRALREGADVIVNTDADNQYNAADIPLLTEPILQGRADYVIGARPIAQIEHFSRAKRLLQRIGSLAVRRVSGVDVPDAPSGFRAVSRRAAYKLNVFNRFTYTLETLIQAGNANIKTVSVPIRTNGETRPSRLFGSTAQYVRRSLLTIVRFFFVYRALPILTALAALLFVSGFALGLRFLFLNFVYGESGHVQSLLLGVLLMLMGVQAGLAGYVADLIGINRRLLENVREIVRRDEHTRLRDRGARETEASTGSDK